MCGRTASGWQHGRPLQRTLTMQPGSELIAYQYCDGDPPCGWLATHTLSLYASVLDRCTGNPQTAGPPAPAPDWAAARHRVGQAWAHLNMTALASSTSAALPSSAATSAPTGDDDIPDEVRRRLMGGQVVPGSMTQGSPAGVNMGAVTAGGTSSVAGTVLPDSAASKRHLTEATSNSSNSSAGALGAQTAAAISSMPLVTKELRTALPDLGCLPPGGEFAGIGNGDKPPQIPAWEVARFPGAHAVIQQAYAIYEEIAARPPFSSTSKNG
jgi:hypothetical protein